MSNPTEQAQPEFLALGGHSDKEQAATTAAGKNHVIAEGFRNRTKGEQLFNRLTYVGVGYFGVTGFSIFLTWLMRDSKWLSPRYEKLTHDLTDKLNKGPFKKLSSFVYSNMTIATLFLGGTIVSVLPVKWLEDHKSKIVQKFDRKIYGDKAVENDPELKLAHAEMDAVPHQTWSSVLGSRILSFATTLGVSLLMGSEKSPISRASGHSIDSVSTTVGRKTDRFLHKNNPVAVEAIAEAEMANKKWFKQPVLMREDQASGILTNKGADRVFTRVLSYITLDGFYTLFTSAALYVSTRVLAPVLGKKQPIVTAQATDTSIPAKKEQAQEPNVRPTEANTPKPHVSQTTHQQRLAQAPSGHELTA